MNRKIVWLAFISVFLVSTVFGMIWSSGFVTTASPRTWTVGPEGPPKYDFANVQPAIDSAKDGDTILVAAGTYKEAIIIYKSLNVIGVNGSDVTMIDAGDIPKAEVVVTIESSHVRVENFTIQYAPEFLSAGIRIRTDLKTISGIVIHKNKVKGVALGIDCGFRISPKYPLTDAEITENTISASTTGIFIGEEFGVISFTNIFIGKNTFTAVGLEAISLISVNKSVICENNISFLRAGMTVEGSSNSITDNTITDIDGWGVNVEGSFNNIEHNKITDVGGDGILVDGSSNNITDNSIIDFTTTGIEDLGYFNNVTSNTIQSGSTGVRRGWYVSNNEIQNCDTGINSSGFISGNDIRNCTTGLWTTSNVSIVDNFLRNCTEGLVMGGNFSTAISNTFLSCLHGVHVLNGTNGNAIYHNMFLNSAAADDSEAFANSWDNRTVGGNYWYDYEGEDFNGDGFGDTPYIIKNVYRNETTNSDNYPLIVPRAPIPIFWKEERYYCIIGGNMTVSRFNMAENKTISFKITGHGYFNLTILRKLLDGAFQIFVNNTQIQCETLWNTTHNLIYFEYATSIPVNVRVEAQFKLVGDLNGDGKVGIADLFIVAKSFGEELEKP